MTESSTASITEQFVNRLDDFGVSSTMTDPEEVETEIEAVASTPTVGVDPSIDGVSLPESVDREVSPAAVEAAATGVTEAVLGVADYGSIVVSTTESGVEPVSLFADQHVAVLREADIVPGMGDALIELGDSFRDDDWSGIIATGPSATADMGALVKGAHGPKTVHVIIVQQ
ncbi:L-lactate dehydrogenase complex protein LldG [Halohasta litchfieldiae]|jgi:L-lactate dehydrogenase complex protein LldG|uniref:L-lactate dehydrogenase complex protein LldG n=1 Tax=Halohasta litchfieldiae TaxID=1073996 RepID=A0A1H6WPQ4_9EURY|nr:L-lactate dehydrogenase complex protein LldG [Halohasta litchfieldiae]SEJ18843.1 L-lactate dehydrogenase complex protein LldG [Halohasta litchfieldiae]